MADWTQRADRRMQEWRDEGARMLATRPRPPQRGPSIPQLLREMPMDVLPDRSTSISLPVTLPVAMSHERTVEELVAQANKIKQAMQTAMEVDHHYGIIPGAKKPSLWKPGAEKLTLLFRLDPQYDSGPVGNDRGEGGHLTIKSVCTLYHIPTGQRFGSGVAICSTRESKYAYRQGKRVCPACGKDAIIKGKEEYGGGWLCFKKQDGCGTKFKEGDAAIESQAVGRIANDELPDTYNTVEKMADKRALVAAVLNCTAASDVFTQDLEDFEVIPEPALVIETPRGKTTSRRAAHQVNAVEPDVQGEEAAQESPAELDEALERSLLLAKCRGAADKGKLDAKTRADLLVKHGISDPRTADLAALTAMLEELRARHG